MLRCCRCAVLRLERRKEGGEVRGWRLKAEVEAKMPVLRTAQGQVKVKVGRKEE